MSLNWGDPHDERDPKGEDVRLLIRWVMFSPIVVFIAAMIWGRP
jgi:hypothetical protein